MSQSIRASAPAVFTFRTTEVRTVTVNDEVWFVASDVAKALNYRIADDMTRNLDNDEKGTQIVRTHGGDQTMQVINESGMYHAVLKSRKPEAKPFRKWVTAEVLPAIRKTGRYETPAPATISPAQQNALQQIVARKAGESGSYRAHLWSRFNNHFQLGSYKQLPAARFTEAVGYMESLPRQGTALPQAPARLPAASVHSLYFTALREILAPVPESHKARLGVGITDCVLRELGLRELAAMNTSNVVEAIRILRENTRIHC